MRKITTFLVLLGLLSSFVPFVTVQAQNVPLRKITFPVIGKVRYSDDFGAARDGGARSHEGNDILGAKLMPLVAAVDGTIRRVEYPEPSYGYSVVIEDKDHYTYHYLHVNNDNPGTDDGKGGGSFAYAADVDDGNKVVAGQLVGWMGDSGNAEGTSPHLHFEIRRPDRTPFSPYQSLRAATVITAPVPRPKLNDELLPFGEFTGGAYIAAGNVDKDSAAEILVGAGPGGGPHVQLLEQNGTVKASFFPYDMAFHGGVDVALADLEGDKRAELITAPGAGGGPNVKIFDVNGREIGSFLAYDPSFTGGVNIAAADVDDDGEDEIITAPGNGGGPHVRVFEKDGTQILSFFAYDTSMTSGLDVAAYTDTRDNVYIATVPGNGATAEVKIFDEEGEERDDFMAYDFTHLGGARITLAQLTSTREPEIITVPLLGGPQAKAFRLSGASAGSAWEFEEWWSGKWDVAAYDDEVFISSGPDTRRRASIREIEFRSSSRNSSRRSR